MSKDKYLVETLHDKYILETLHQAQKYIESQTFKIGGDEYNQEDEIKLLSRIIVAKSLLEPLL